MDLNDNWGETIHREASSVPVTSQTSFDDLMYFGFSVPLRDHLTAILGKPGWLFSVQDEALGVEGSRHTPEGEVQTIFVTVSRDFKSITIWYDGVTTPSMKSSIPFLPAQSGLPLSRLFGLVVGKLPKSAHSPV